MGRAAGAPWGRGSDRAGRAQRGPNLFIVNFGTREGECEDWRGFAGY